jgi:hypothetical protein
MLKANCSYCIFAAPYSKGKNKSNCHYGPPLVGKPWPIMGENDFCGKWRGEDQDYLDLFPKKD